MSDICCDDEPKWVSQVVQRLEAAGYTVTSRYDIDGFEWQNKMYTVIKGAITYMQDVRALYLLRIPIG